MLVLSGVDFPATAPALIAAVNGGLSAFFQLPPGRGVVELTGEFPHFSKAVVNLTDAATAADCLPPEPRGTGKQFPAFEVARLEVSAQPMRIRGNPLSLSIAADNVAFDYDRDLADKPVLLLRDAHNGQLTASIDKSDLQSLIVSAAKEAGDEHGIAILDASLQWTQLDSRSVGLALTVTARKLVKAQITVVGRLIIDDAMIARLSGLECNGTGMISTLACAAIRPKLHQVEGKSLSLGALAAGQVRLRDVQITVGDSLVVQARFGG
jgi:hypothetical protein